MADNKRIHYIPPLPTKREKRVGIYCRVSTNSLTILKEHMPQKDFEKLQFAEAPEDFLKAVKSSKINQF